jgi:TolB-like protein
MKISMRYPAFIFLLVCLVYSVSGQENEKLRIAILDFTNTGGLSKQETVTLGNRLSSMLVETNAFIVLERGQMDEILEEQGFQQTGCTTTECAVEMGRLLNVQKMISGSIGKLGSTYTIDLSLIDVQTAQIEKSFFRDFRGEIDGLLDIMQEISTQIASIVGGTKAPEVKEEPKIFSLEVTSDPEGATLFINDKQVGRTPFESKAREGLTVKIRLEKENYKPWERTINISDDQEIEAELEYTEAYKNALAAAEAKEGGSSLWWWIGGGALVVGGAAVLLMSSGSGGDEGTSSTDTGFPSPPDRPTQ